MSEQMKIEKSISGQIENWRSDGGWSQSALARAARMPQSCLSRMESGKHLPTLRSLKRVAKPLNADVVVRLVRRDRSPLDDGLVDRVAAAIVNCHPDSGRGYKWEDWLQDCKRKDYHGEMACEWVEARRNEARAAIEVLALTDEQ